MILHKKLNQNHNTKQAKETLTKAMGYGNVKKGLVTLSEFIEAGSIEAWLGQGQYDFRYGNEGFVVVLAKVLEIDASLVIREAHRRIGLMSQYATTSLHVVVNFERKGESIFTLMGYNKYLVVDYDTQTLVGLSDDVVCSRRSHSDTLPMNTRTASRFVLGHLADEYSDSFG